MNWDRNSNKMDNSTVLFDIKLIGVDDLKCYYKRFTYADFMELSGFNHLSITKLYDLISYCLSDKNYQHNVSYKIIKSELNINIDYKTEYFTMNIPLKIPFKHASKLDILTNKIKEQDIIIKELKNELNMINKYTPYTPIVFKREMNKELMLKKWHGIKLQNVNYNDDNISLDSQRNNIILEQGRYIINVKCIHSCEQTLKGMRLSMFTLNNVNIGTINGCIGNGISWIVNHTICVQNKTKLKLQIYLYNDDNAQELYPVYSSQFQFTVCVSVQKY